jgi:hypothetical protein
MIGPLYTVELELPDCASANGQHTINTIRITFCINRLPVDLAHPSLDSVPAASVPKQLTAGRVVGKFSSACLGPL